MILNLQHIIANISNFHLLIVGRESVSIMTSILETIKEEVNVVYTRANAYISLVDKILLTCGNLLNAMGYALPILSTSDRFAIEIVKHDWALIVPFDDDQIFVESLIQFLNNETLMKILSKTAQQFVKNLTWDNIAKDYTILFQNGLFTNLNLFSRTLAAMIHMKIGLLDEQWRNELRSSRYFLISDWQ